MMIICDKESLLSSRRVDQKENHSSLALLRGRSIKGKHFVASLLFLFLYLRKIIGIVIIIVEFYLPFFIKVNRIIPSFTDHSSMSFFVMNDFRTHDFKKLTSSFVSFSSNVTKILCKVSMSLFLRFAILILPFFCISSLFF